MTRPSKTLIGTLALGAVFAVACTAMAAEGDALRESVREVAAVQITVAIGNIAIRIAAIAAGTYVVWLGHNTMVRGIKGEFEFEGAFGKLKGSVPGLFFVLMGVVAIGWALNTKIDSDLNIGTGQPDRETADTEIPPPPPPPPPS